jgi:hypothetical protein
MGKANLFLLRRCESALIREGVIRSTVLLLVDAEEMEVEPSLVKTGVLQQ